MSIKPFSRYNVYKELTPNDWTILFDLAIAIQNENGNVPGILGKSTRESIDLTSAYSTNKEMYPFAFLVYTKNRETRKIPIAFVLVTQMSDGYSIEIAAKDGKDETLATLEIASEISQFIRENTDNITSCYMYNIRACEILEQLQQL